MSGVAEPRVEAPDGGLLEQSGGEQGQVGWLGAAAGLVKAGWGEEGCPADQCMWRVKEEVEEGEVEVEEEECRN